MMMREVVERIGVAASVGVVLWLLVGVSAEPMRPSSGDQCNKTVGMYDVVTSPAVTPANVGKSVLCHYRVRPFPPSTSRDWILRVRFSTFKVGRLVNSTHCEGGYFQILDGDPQGKSVARANAGGYFCGEIETETTFISETSHVKLIFYAENLTSQVYFRFDLRAEQQHNVYLRYGQHPELYPNRRGELMPGTYCDRVFRDCRLQTCYVQSPGYPGIYPRNLRCRFMINTRLPFIKLHMENEEFSVGGVPCDNLIECPVKPISNDCVGGDHLKVYDGKDDKSPLIGIFCGVGKFPVSLIGTGSDIFVEFITTPAGPLSSNLGFHFAVGHWPGHSEMLGESNGSCAWVFTSEDLQRRGEKQGLFWSVSHWYPPKTRCSYLMKGNPNEIVRLEFPSFRIDKVSAPIDKVDSDCAESLTIFDSDHQDDSKIIKTFCDTSRALEKVDFVSTSNALLVVFESKTGSYEGSSLYYWSTYDFFNNSKYGVAEEGSLCDEVFVPWGPGGRTEGRFGSPLNTLIYKGENVICTFKFESVKRLFARVLIRIANINFKFNQYPCTSCLTDRTDKLILSDGGNKTICVCKDNVNSFSYPITLTSVDTSASVSLAVDGRHAVANYFKSPVPIFEGSYRFIHGPLCGATRLGPSSDGKLRFPYFYNPQLKEQPVHCLWELSTHPGKDLWINLEKLVFSTSSKSCGDAKLELHVPSANKHNSPLLTLCGDSNVGDRKTEISSQLPIISADKLKGGITIRLEASTGSKLNFVISWTELTRLDGSKTDAMRGGCGGYLCPGTDICIERDLLCNGIKNCPNNTEGAGDESEVVCKGVGRDGGGENQFVVLNYRFNFSWVTASVFGGGLALATSLFCILCFCCFCGRRKDDDRHQHDDDFLT